MIPRLASTIIPPPAPDVKHNHGAGESAAIRSQAAGCIFQPGGGSGPPPRRYDVRPEPLGDARSLRAKVFI